MIKLCTALGCLIIFSATGTQAATNKESSWRQVSSVTLNRLVEPNQGGRAALCSWVDSKKQQTTIIVATKGKDDSYGINKLVYELGKAEPKITNAKITTDFIPRTILRTSGGILYLVANSGINNDWSEYLFFGKKDEPFLTSPKSLKGEIWVSLDDGDNWTKLNLLKKHNNNAGYITCYKPVGTNDTIDNTAIRIGGAGICSTEITCFKHKVNAEKYQNITQNRSQKIPNTFSSILHQVGNRYFVISNAVDVDNNTTSDAFLVNIGELPVNNQGTVLANNILKFNYMIGKMKGKGHLTHSNDFSWFFSAGTPIFNDPSHLQKNNISYNRLKHPQGQIISEHDFLHPVDYYILPIEDLSLNTKTKKTINGKYRHCITTYDNTGLILAGEWKLIPDEFNGIDIRFGSVQQAANRQKGSNRISAPQEVVAQHKGFIAAVAKPDDSCQIYVSDKINDNTTQKMTLTQFDHNTSGYDRIMIAGVNQLGWYSNEEDINLYNGKLLAIGQSPISLKQQTSLKLYMSPTTVKIKNSCASFTGDITGEPYTKVEYWWQRRDSNVAFSSINRQGGQTTKDSGSSIMHTGTAFLDKDGVTSIKYEAKDSGDYRLVVAAIVGGFYCDYEQTTGGDTDFNKIGLASEIANVHLKIIDKQTLTLTHTVNGKKVTINIPSTTDLKPNTTQSLIRVCPNSEVNFDAKVSYVNNTINNDNNYRVNATWSINDKIINNSKDTLTYKFNNSGSNEVMYKVRYNPNEPCAQNLEEVCDVISWPKLQDYTIKQELINSEPKQTKLSIKESEHYTQSWLLKDVNSNKKWHTISSNYELYTPHIASIPALNPNPSFDKTMDGWLVNDWITTDLASDNNGGIGHALIGVTAQTLSSKDYIPIDPNLLYLYTAVAKNVEDGTKITLTLECYDREEKKLANVNLPDAYLTKEWSSFGAVIGNTKDCSSSQNATNTSSSDKNRCYLLPRGTTLVKLAIKLPESKRIDQGAQISAIRLIELPKETYEALNDYTKNFSAKDRNNPFNIDMTFSTVNDKNQNYNQSDNQNYRLPKNTPFSRALFNAVKTMKQPTITDTSLNDYTKSVSAKKEDNPFSIAMAWDALVGRRAKGTEPIENTYKVIIVDNHGCNATKYALAKVINVEPKFYFNQYAAYINGKSKSSLDVDANLNNSMTVSVERGQNLTLNFTPIYSGEVQFVWENMLDNNIWQKISEKSNNSFTITTAKCFVSKQKNDSFRCKAIIKDNEYPKINYSRIFKVTQNSTDLTSIGARINNQETLSASIAPGEKVTLTATHADVNDATYQWFTKGKNSEWTALLNKTSASLVVESAASPITNEYAVAISSCNKTQYINQTQNPFKITTIAKSPAFVISGDNYSVAQGVIGNGAVNYKECVDVKNNNRDNQRCDKAKADSYRVIENTNVTILAAGPAINADPTFLKCESGNDCLEQILTDKKVTPLTSVQSDTQECGFHVGAISLENEPSPYSGKVIKTLCGDVTVRNTDFTLIAKNITYLVIANVHSSKNETNAAMTISAYDLNENLLGNILIDETSIGTHWTSLGGLIRVDKNKKYKDSISLPKETVFIKYNVNLNIGDESSDGYLSNVRIIPLTDTELVGLSQRPKDERLVNYWDSRAGSNALGNQSRNYHYYGEATSATFLRDESTVIGKPKLAIAMRVADTNIAGGTNVNFEAYVTPHDDNLYSFYWQVSDDNGKHWKPACNKDDTATQGNNLLRTLEYPTKVVKEVQSLSMRLMATPVINKDRKPVYSNEVTIKLYPTASYNAQLDDVVTCIDSDETISLDTDNYQQVQWQTAQLDSSDFKDYPGATDYIFKLPTDKVGKYKVRANIITSYSKIMQSTIATITVLEGVIIGHQPTDVDTYINKTNSLQVMATGDNLSYAWEYRLADNEPWQLVNNATTNVLEVVSSKPQAQYRALVTTGNKVCPRVISNTATITAFNNIKINNIGGKSVVLAGHLAYFETDAPDDCEIAWDIYPTDGHGHYQQKDFKFLPNNNRTIGKKSIKLLMPSNPGTYMIKATITHEVNNNHKSCAWGIHVIEKGKQGASGPYNSFGYMGLFTFIKLQQAMNSKAGDPNYDATMDANGDGKVDAADEKIFLDKFKEENR